MLPEAAPDNPLYAIQAQPHAAPNTMLQRAQSKKYRADCSVGQQVITALQGTDIDFVCNFEEDGGRFTAILSRLENLFPPTETVEDEQAALREKLIGQKSGMGSTSESTWIVLDEQLDQKQQWLNYMNKIQPVLKIHRGFAPGAIPAGPGGVPAAAPPHVNHISDATMLRLVFMKIKQMKRYNKDNALYTAVEQAPSLQSALQALIIWDQKKENQYEPDKGATSAFHVSEARAHHVSKYGLDKWNMDATASKHFQACAVKHAIEHNGTHKTHL